jgi:hypothetical protein
VVRAFVLDLCRGTLYALVFAIGAAGFGAWLWGAW